jgi:uncharacterized protein YndB with AHSA1/START domain
LEKIAVERSIWIDAPRERVWRAITDPEQIQSWFSPGTTWQLSALQVGGKLSVHNPDTGTDLYVNVIELVDPPHRLAMRSEPEPPDTPRVTTWTLEEEKGGTRVTVTEAGYELYTDDTRQQRMDQDSMGFGMLLENLQAHVDGRPLPYPGGF